jgi:hypothetical protein
MITLTASEALVSAAWVRRPTLLSSSTLEWSASCRRRREEASSGPGVGSSFRPTARPVKKIFSVSMFYSQNISLRTKILQNLAKPIKLA